MKTIERIEDIYPLTIVKIRFGGDIVLFECDSDASWVSDVQLSEEISYELESWMLENVFCPFGFGNTIETAFQDFVRRKNSKIV